MLFRSSIDPIDRAAALTRTKVVPAITNSMSRPAGRFVRRTCEVVRCATREQEQFRGFGYESRVRGRERRVLSAPGAMRAKRWSSSERTTAYGCGANDVPAVAQPLPIKGAVTAWRGGRDRISHTHLNRASRTRLEVTREELDYPYAHADAR